MQSGSVDFIVTIPYQPKTVSVQLVKNGAVIAQERTKGRDIEIKFRYEVDTSVPEWFRLDITDKDGDVLAITNPFFLGLGKKNDRYHYLDFKP